MKKEDKMKRVIEAEMETKAKKFSTALNRFFKKYPYLEYWREEFEYMYDNGENTTNDTILGDGTYNTNWRYSLHLQDNGGSFYICVIERE